VDEHGCCIHCGAPRSEPRTPETDFLTVAVLTAAIDGGDDALASVAPLLPEDFYDSALIRGIVALSGAMLRSARDAGYPVVTIMSEWAMIEVEQHRRETDGD